MLIKSWWLKALANPFTPKSDLIDFTLSNARQFYSSKGDLLGVKLLRCLIYGLYKPYNTTVIKLAKSNNKSLLEIAQ